MKINILANFKKVFITALFVGGLAILFTGNAEAVGTPSNRMPDPDYVTNYQNFGDPSIGDNLYLSVGYGEHISGETVTEIYTTGGTVNLVVEEATACFRSQPGGGSGTVDIRASGKAWPGNFDTTYTVYDNNNNFVTSIVAEATCTNVDRLITFNGTPNGKYRLEASVINSNQSGENLYKLVVNSPNKLGIGPRTHGGFSITNRDLPYGYNSSYGVYFATPCVGSTIGSGGLTFYDADAYPANPSGYQSISPYPNLTVVLSTRVQGAENDGDPSNDSWVQIGSVNLTGGNRQPDIMPGVNFPPGQEYQLQIFGLSRPNALEILLNSGFSQENVGRPCNVGNDDPIGYADSCILSGSTTIIYGWGYDDNAAANDGRPQIVTRLNGANARTLNTTYSYRNNEINGYLTGSGYGTNARDNRYGFRVSYTGLTRGTTYNLSGTVVNTGGGSNQALGIHTDAAPPPNPVAGSHGFPGSRIPDACLPDAPPTGWNYQHRAFSLNRSSPVSPGQSITASGYVRNIGTGRGDNYSYWIEYQIDGGAWSGVGTRYGNRTALNNGQNSPTFSRTYNGTSALAHNTEVCLRAAFDPSGGQSTPTLTVTSGVEYSNPGCVTIQRLTVRCEDSGITFSPASPIDVGTNFTSRVQINNPNSYNVGGISASYAITGAGVDGSGLSGIGNGGPNSLGAGGNGAFNSGGIRVNTVGTYTITWTITSNNGTDPCRTTFETTFSMPECSATLPNIETGQTNRPTFTLTNRSSIPLQVTSASYEIDRSGGGTSLSGNFNTGFSPPVSAGNNQQSTYPNYPPAAELAPFTDAGVYTLTWPTINFTAGGQSYSISGCGPAVGDVSDRPYVRFYGNDVVTCGTGNSANINVNMSYDGAENFANHRGSASQLAVMAAGINGAPISGTSPQQGLLPGALTDRGNLSALAFANTGGVTTNNFTFGGEFSGNVCGRSIQDEYNRVVSGLTGYADTQINLNSVDGRVLINGDTRISGTNLNNRNIVMAVDGDVNIENDITISNTGWDVDTIPSFVLYVDGDVFINNNVEQVHGNIVATGDIYTCSDDFNSYLSNPEDIEDDCTNQLIIEGSLRAGGNVHFHRINGSVLEGSSYEAHASGSIAESIRFNPEIYIIDDGAGMPAIGGQPAYDSIIARPPSF